MGRFRIAPHRPSACSACAGAETTHNQRPFETRTPKHNTSRHTSDSRQPFFWQRASKSSPGPPRGTRGHASSWPMPGAHATPRRAIWSEATNEAVANARHRLAMPARPSDAVCGSCNLVGSASHPHPWLLRADWTAACAAQPITVAALLAHHRSLLSRH